VTWAGTGRQYPGVDLSVLPERDAFVEARPEPFEEFSRLRELVRPVAPAGADLSPGAEFGPLVGSAVGSFGPFVFQNPWTLLVSREVLERLQAEGVRGLKGYRTELRFRQKKAPELLELQLEPRGLLHLDCIPPEARVPCTKCGRQGFRLPEEPILEAASLPEDIDLFRVANFATILVGTERFRDAVQRLELDGIVLRELPLR
jgi:uncharacterized double-CXXCG motif protein